MMTTYVAVARPSSTVPGTYEVELYATDGAFIETRVARSYRGALRIMANHSRRLWGMSAHG